MATATTSPQAQEAIVTGIPANITLAQRLEVARTFTSTVLPTAPRLVDVEVTYEGGIYTSFPRWVVTPVWGEVDRPRSHSISVTSEKDARRLERAMRDGVAFKAPSIRMDVEGTTYVCDDCQVFGKWLDADLKKLGY